jgi:TatD DNase family protein
VTANVANERPRAVIGPANGHRSGDAAKVNTVTLPMLPEPLPSPVVDSHCHLDVTEAVSGLAPAEAVQLAGRVGVTRIVQIGCDVPGSRWAVSAAERWPNVIAGVAIHPNDAARLGQELAAELAVIERLAGNPRVRAVGETGLDFYRTRNAAGHAAQRESFAAHIAFAKAEDKTLVIHDRDAHREILTMLDSEGLPGRVVMHCFSGDADFARACLDRGAYLSFAGTATFKNNDALRGALAVTPLDRLLTETDAPYLTPVPHRGRPNASYLIPHTARFLAQVRGVELAKLCRALNDNADAAFGGW